MKKKILAMFLLLTIAFSLAAGCSDNKGTTPQADGANSGQTSTPDGKSASEETVRITAFLPGTEDNATEAYYAIYENLKKKHSNIEFEITQIPWADYFTKLNVSFSGDTAPDLYGVGLGQIGPVQASGNMLPLDDYLTGWDGYEDIPSNVLDIGRKDGVLYCLPMLEMRILWYRTDLFKEAGLDRPPQTLDEIYEYAKKLTKHDGSGNITMSGLEIGTGEQSLFSVMLMHGADTYWDENLKSTMLEPKAQEALKWCNTIMSEKLSDHTIMHDIQGTLFENGLAAMSFAGSSVFVTFANKLGLENIAVSTLPTEKYMIGCTAWSVYNGTDHPEDAIKMWKEITSKEGQLIIAEKIGFVPTRKSAKEEYIAMNPDFNDVFFEAASKAQAYGVTNKYFFEFVNNIRPLIDEVYYGQKEPEEAMIEFEKKYEAAKEQ
jgi:multiple sugar transport system substrate-binding protein